MSSQTTQIAAVPTNIITGFLGVGKTSAILNLLKRKPADERWAVLVNEFGEIGVDGSLFQGQHDEQQGVFVREVPGGCMCCAAGLPMQVALSQLLSKARPDRLLIEPTGLGHPKEIIQVLSSDKFSNALDLQKVITLVDARKLSDKRYTEHETFNQQIAIADTIVGNKQDLYNSNDSAALTTYVQDHGQAHAKVVLTQQGDIPLECLEGKTLATTEAHQHHHEKLKPLLADAIIPECGYISANNKGEGFFSAGWRFLPSKVFDYQKLNTLLNSIQAERLKAVFITDQGMFGYNLTADSLTENTLQTCSESRLEIITRQRCESFESQLLSCIAV